MKVFYFITLIITLSFAQLVAQTGTIKIAKPKESNSKKDSLPPEKWFGTKLYASSNYTFKGNDDFGFEAGISLGRYHQRIGIEYCFENQYYQISSFDSIRQTNLKSKNQSSFIKIPWSFGADNMTFGTMRGSRNTRINFLLGVAGEYLLAYKNEDDKLKINNFNRFNLSWHFQLGYSIKRVGISLKYSHDFFQNLKDIRLYDISGNAIGKQKSKTNLLSFSLSYKFYD